MSERRGDVVVGCFFFLLALLPAARIISIIDISNAHIPSLNYCVREIREMMMRL